jgi:hypothetical protein
VKAFILFQKATETATSQAATAKIQLTYLGMRAQQKATCYTYQTSKCYQSHYDFDCFAHWGCLFLQINGVCRMCRRLQLVPNEPQAEHRFRFFGL